MTGSLARGAPSFNSMFFKPMMRKNYHKTGTPADTVRETAVKLNTEEGVATTRRQSLQDGNCTSWVPHEKTGIYYPKGQEKVMEDIPVGAATDIIDVNWDLSIHKGDFVILYEGDFATLRSKIVSHVAAETTQLVTCEGVLH